MSSRGFAVFIWVFGILAATIIVAYGKDDTAPVSPAVEMLMDGGAHHAAGVYIGNGLILTAGHVVFDGEAFRKDLKIVNERGEHYAVSIMVFDKTHDLALVKIDAKPGSPFTAADLRCDAPIVGEEVTVVGYPMDFGRTVSFGHVNVAYFFDGMDNFMIDAATTHGNSGGPVFDKAGKVLGLLDAGFDNTNVDFRFAVPVTPICRLLGMA